MNSVNSDKMLYKRVMIYGTIGELKLYLSFEEKSTRENFKKFFQKLIILCCYSNRKMGHKSYRHSKFFIFSKYNA